MINVGQEKASHPLYLLRGTKTALFQEIGPKNLKIHIFLNVYHGSDAVLSVFPRCLCLIIATAHSFLPILETRTLRLGEES